MALKHINDKLNEFYNKEYTNTNEYKKYNEMINRLQKGDYVKKEQMIEIMMGFSMMNDRFIQRLVRMAVISNHNAIVSQIVLKHQEQSLSIVDGLIDKTNKARDMHEAIFGEGDSDG